MKVVDMHCDTISELFYRMEDGKEHSVWKNDCHVDLERMEKGTTVSRILRCLRRWTGMRSRLNTA